MRLSLAFLALLASPTAEADSILSIPSSTSLLRQRRGLASTSGSSTNYKYLCRREQHSQKNVCEKGHLLAQGPEAANCTEVADNTTTPCNTKKVPGFCNIFECPSEDDPPSDSISNPSHDSPSEVSNPSHDSSSEVSNPSSSSSEDSPSCSDLQDGFECGMAPEVTGLWAGDEKYYEASDTFDYCTMALFNPAEGKNFLTWNGGYLGYGDGTQPESCMDIGVNALGKTINGTWMTYLSPSEAYILQVEQKKCIDECDYDVTETVDLAGYSVVSKACGAHLKKDSFRPGEFSCELYQTNLIEDGSGNQEVVVVLTYFTYYGSYDNYVCPEKPTFNQADLKNDPNAQGTALFVLQANDLSDSFNITNWDCLED